MWDLAADHPVLPVILARITLAPTPVLALFLLAAVPFPGRAQDPGPSGESIRLPDPTLDGPVSVESAIQARRSVRDFAEEPLALAALSQLLWAGQGVTEPMEDAPPGFRWPWAGGLRAAPSAGALYPLEVYAVVGGVEGLDPGLYRYLPSRHALEPLAEGDPREDVWGAALRQSAIRSAPVTLVIAGVVARTAAKYGDRAERYVHMEVGAASENVWLQAQALGLGAVFIGAFRDEEVRRILDLPEDHHVYGIMPLGRPAGGS